MATSEDDFLEYMNMDFPDLKITRSNLSFPTTEFVASYYTTMLKSIIQINGIERLWSLTDSQMDYLRNLHQEAPILQQHVQAHNLHLTIKYIFQHLTPNPLAEFFFSDILLPFNTPHRSFVFMSMMLNYYYYYVDLCNDLNTDISTCEEKSRKRKEFEETIGKLHAELAMQETMKSQLGETIKQIRSSIVSETEKHEEQQQILKEMNSKHEELKNDLQKCDEEEQALQDILTKLTNEEKYYESLIVSNESQVMDVHAKRLSTKDKCVQKMKSLEEQVHVASNKLNQCNKVIELQQKLFNALEDEKCSESQAKQEDFKYLYDTMHALKEKMAHIADEDKTLGKKIDEMADVLPKLEKEQQELEEEQAAISCKGKDRTATVSNYIENANKSHAQLLLKAQTESLEMSTLNEQISDLTAKCDDLLKNMKDIDNLTKEKYFSFVEDMKNTLNSLRGAFNEV